ncbi:unnamed protein product [Adineta ricciae]|uniref:Uncharacterized protein n=1 Tax=Adineta ricciae TaxID=249248 RepID=A0A815M3U1_ADIRI|nr:unnamed protein product [Adineta ricciae]CAF1417121.1 unnamed protein product [Adineta ricciae]
MTLLIWLKSIIKRAFDNLLAWNAFNSRSSDPTIIRRELFTTRLYLILLIVSLVVLTTYTSFTVRFNTQSLLNPTYSQYQQLHNDYADTLQCSCSKISVPYGQFVTTMAIFHQVCSSDFVSQQWIDFTFLSNLQSLSLIDVRTHLNVMWQFIRSFCQNANRTTIDILDQLHKTSLITPILLDEHLLKAKIQSTLSSLLQIESVHLIQAIEIAERTVHANQLLTALGNNYVVSTNYTKEAIYHKSMPSYFFVDISKTQFILNSSQKACVCETDCSCLLPGHIYLYNITSSSNFYDIHQIPSNITLPGLFIDCLPLQTTFASSFECFYQQSCLDLLLSTYQHKINISILNSSQPTRFHPTTTTIESIFNELFLEQINNQTNYEKYYLSCSPNTCFYPFNHRFDWIYVLTTFFGLLGGISVALRIFTSYFIRLALSLYKFCFSTDRSIRQTSNETFLNRIKRILQQIKEKLINLNIYTKYSQDQTRVYHGRLSTRLYFLLLLISIIIIIIYSSVLVEIVTEQMINPSLEQYHQLQQQYPLTLRCPCTQLAISYKDFVTIEAKYHQMCLSEFVQSWWYQSLLLPYNTQARLSFVTLASSYFQTLATFCELANKTINNGTEQFLSTTFVNGYVLSNDSFYVQMTSLISSFIDKIGYEFVYRISLTQLLLHSNQYVSHLPFSTYLSKIFSYSYNELRDIKISVDPIYAINDNSNKRCYCVLDSNCTLEDKVIQGANLISVSWKIGGIYGGCSMVDTTFKSSFASWFDDNFINILKREFLLSNINIPRFPTKLHPTLPSRYSPTTPTESIFNNLMIEDWNVTYSYENYYSQCRPSSCSFIYEKKTDSAYLVTVILSLIGGINLILRLVSPLIIKINLKLIKSLNHCASLTVEQQQNHHKSQLFTTIINQLLIFNMFDSESNDSRIIHRERLTTKLYLLILCLSLYSIIIYAMITNGKINITVFNPIESDYSKLLMLHSESLQCPCNNISMKYKEFLFVDTLFHEVCSSDFVQTKWRDYLFLTGDWFSYYRADIRSRGSIYFSFLSTLCQLSKTTVNNGIVQFLDEIFINIQIISRSEFYLRIDSFVSQSQQRITTQFSRSFNSLRDVLNNNALISSYYLNSNWSIDLNTTYTTIPTHTVITKNGCSCGTRYDCIESGGIYYDNTDSQKFAIPGWNVGCSVVETVLRSTMECFYNQSCIDSLLFYATTVPNRLSYRMNMTSMNSSAKSRFRRDTFIQDLADELFVETWQTYRSYSLFYKACAPISCSYTVQKTDYYMYSASKVLGLYGGLSILLRFVVPLVVKIFFCIRTSCQTTEVVPFN